VNSRVTTAYVSAYNRQRPQVAQLRRHESREVVADFRGAIHQDAVIESVEWRCTSPWVCAMSAPAVASDGKCVSVRADFQFGGFCALKATVALDNGDTMNQVFEFTVRDAPYFFENSPVTAGPFVVTA